MVPEKYHRLLHLEAGADFSLQKIKFASEHVAQRIADLLAKRTEQQVGSLPVSGRLHDVVCFEAGTAADGSTPSGIVRCPANCSFGQCWMCWGRRVHGAW